MRSERPQPTAAERARIKQIYANLPQKLRNIGNRAEETIERLYQEGASWKLAERKVMAVIQGHIEDLQRLNTAPVYKDLRELKIN